MFVPFWLGNALRASATCTLSAVHLPKVLRTWGAFSVWTSKRASRQAACTFWTSERPKVFQTWSVLRILASKCASHLSCMQFLISHQPRGSAPGALGSLLFSTLRSHKSLEKHSVLWFFYLFGHLHLLSSDSFSALLSSALLFSNSSYLCCFICPYCRKFDF